MQETILSLVPAEAGWRALYRAEYEDDAESARVVAWALVEENDGERRVVGLVVDPADPTRIVPAPEGVSALAPDFERYGFKVD